MSYIRRLLIRLADWLFERLWGPEEDFVGFIDFSDVLVEDDLWSTTYAECGCGLMFNAFQWDFDIQPCHTHMQLGV